MNEIFKNFNPKIYPEIYNFLKDTLLITEFLPFKTTIVEDKDGFTEELIEELNFEEKLYFVMNEAMQGIRDIFLAKHLPIEQLKNILLDETIPPRGIYSINEHYTGRADFAKQAGRLKIKEVIPELIEIANYDKFLDMRISALNSLDDLKISNEEIINILKNGSYKEFKYGDELGIEIYEILNSRKTNFSSTLIEKDLEESIDKLIQVRKNYSEFIKKLEKENSDDIDSIINRKEKYENLISEYLQRNYIFKDYLKEFFKSHPKKAFSYSKEIMGKVVYPDDVMDVIKGFYWKKNYEWLTVWLKQENLKNHINNMEKTKNKIMLLNQEQIEEINGFIKSLNYFSISNIGLYFKNSENNKYTFVKITGETEENSKDFISSALRIIEERPF